MASGTNDGTGRSAGRELVAMLRDDFVKSMELAGLLDALSHEERVAAIRTLRAREQRRLYEVSEGFAPVRLVELVSPDVGEFGVVRHYGKNSLPFFTEFEKRFARAPGIDPVHPSELMGFNYQDRWRRSPAPVTSSRPRTRSGARC